MAALLAEEDTNTLGLSLDVVVLKVKIMVTDSS